MIQLINYNGFKENISGNLIEVNSIGSPESLDEFEINIIDLNDNQIWRNDEDGTRTINCIIDFINLGEMISRINNTKIIIVLPQNQKFLCNMGYCSNDTYDYTQYIELKNILPKLKDDYLSKLSDSFYYNLVYENTRTNIGGENIAASFYFDCNTEDIITKSEKSLKATSVLCNDILMTTLELSSYEQIISYLKQVGYIQEKETQPQWIIDMDKFNDREQKEFIKEREKEITEISVKINEAKKVLEKNNEYKSILYTNGDELVKVVFEIIEELLDCDLSLFIDEKKEDFLIKMDGITFIGEIKGVTSNVKSEHISQLEVHYYNYTEKLESEGKSENVKQLLIINHQRTHQLSDRAEVHEIQIALAKRNGSLIIETTTLLDMYEKLKKGQLDVSQCKQILRENTGLLKLE